MADPLAVVVRIFKLGQAIKTAVQTVRQNKKECQDIKRCVARIDALLSLLNETTEPIRHPAISAPLQDLEESLEEALELITDCQEKNAVRRLWAAGDMAKQLRRVQDDILRKLTLGNFACNVQFTITLTNTIRCVGGAHQLVTQLPDTAEMKISRNSPSTMGDARSVEYDDNIITMVTTGTEAPSAPSSGVTEFSLSETVTKHHVSEESINGGSGQYNIVSRGFSTHGQLGQLQQTIVIKMQMSCVKSRGKAIMSLVAATYGVESVTLIGRSDRVLVMGNGVDSVDLTNALRRRVGPAMLVQVQLGEYPPVMNAMEEAQQGPATRWPHARSSGGIRAITAKLLEFMRPRPRSRSSPGQAVAPSSLPLLITPDPTTGPWPHLLPVESPATLIEKPLPTAPVRRRRHTFNMSKVHRRVCLPTVRQPRMMPPVTRVEALSLQRSRARVLTFLVCCTMCALVLLASVWALR